jgi:cold shock CspA family protein
MDFCHKYREMVNNHTRDTRPTIAEALESIGAVHSVPSDIAEELNLFFGRWHDIKQAANRAPIAGETRNVIDDLRTELEAEVEEIKEREYESEEAAEEKDPLHGRDYEGEVVFFNNVGDCGFIESEDVADGLFFDLTEIDSIEGRVNVAFDIEQYEKGPMARSVIILEDE